MEIYAVVLKVNSSGHEVNSEKTLCGIISIGPDIPHSSEHTNSRASGNQACLTS